MVGLKRHGQSNCSTSGITTLSSGVTGSFVVFRIYGLTDFRPAAQGNINSHLTDNCKSNGEPDNGDTRGLSIPSLMAAHNRNR